ncbi:hsp90 co-chaperone Cdc37-like [Planococcus citri]|uniref:hsp90 co-chaperone Cdc37-like n=1 Tax=Planococcus citri TaxID=170843 RepID=UPI0031FA3964
MAQNNMVDYSKWKTIELSSDEDDVHPFIENGTLFRLRHEHRLRKMEDRKKEEFAFECQRASYLDRLSKLEASMENNEKQGKENEELVEKMKELQIEEKQLKEKEEKLNKQVVAWYIDTICKPGFSKAQINKSDEKPEDFEQFIENNEEKLQHFGHLKTFEETQNFLINHPHLMCRNTLYYLISYGIELHLQSDKDKLRSVSRQIVCLENILELFKKVTKNRKEVLVSFFQNIISSDEQTKHDFKREYLKVEKQIKELVEERIQEEAENPVKDDDHTYALSAEEVYKSLPEEMQHCFLASDKEALANVIHNMPEDLANYHMQRCIDSGLWVP